MSYKQKMTFGFEIEGAFKIGLKDKLLDISPNSVLKQDGSVNFNHHEMSKFIGDVDDWFGNYLETIGRNYATEINTGVFKDYKKMLRALRIFKDDKNYISNKSCGLHIHLGFGKDKISRAKLADMKVMEILQDYAKNNLCDHIRERLEENSYCYPYKLDKRNRSDSLYSFITGQKYRFMRNHDKTFEFRFFSACEHRQENVEKFFKFLFKFLKTYNPKVTAKIKVDENKNIKIKQDTTKKEAMDWRIYPPFRIINTAQNQELNIVENVITRTGNNNDGIISFGLNRSDCEGYHNDCDCEDCENRRQNDGYCSNGCCLECGDGCGDPHCENCGNEDYCEDRDCEWCRDNHEDRWNEDFCDCEDHRQRRGEI